MFSLQTIFGKGDKFYGLLEASAEAALLSAKALETMLAEGAETPALDEVRVARRREKDLFAQINLELVNTFVTALEREDIEALAGALYKIPKTVEKFAERHALFADRLQTALALAKQYDVEMPIAQEVHNGIYEGKSVQRCLIDLLSREQKDELADVEQWALRANGERTRV